MEFLLYTRRPQLPNESVACLPSPVVFGFVLIRLNSFMKLHLTAFFILTVFLSSVGVLSSRATQMMALTTGNQLLVIDSATPGTVLRTVAITGLQTGEVLHGIDFRPATGELFGIGSSNLLYVINTNSGVASMVGSGPFGTLNGTAFGFDFNPTVDRIRIVSDTDQDIRINPNNGGLAGTDVTLSYAVGDPHAGANPNIVGVAYANNFAGASSTTLYGIDSALDILVIQNPPNNGTLNTVGALGFNANSVCGFDISDFGNVAYAAMAAPGDSVSTLFQINLTTGAATSLGTIGGGTLIRGLSVIPAGTVLFSSALFFGSEQNTNAVITLARVGGSQGGMTIGYNTAPGTATAGADYQPVSGVISFANGETNKTFNVPIFPDAIPELNETVLLSLSVSPGDGLLGTNANATLQIVSTQDLPVYLLTVSNRLLRFSASPSLIQSNVLITGLQPKESILGIDFRPANGQLYGLGSSNRLYTIDPASGVASLVGSPGLFTLAGTNFGFDFNPVPDRIRVVSNAGQDFRLNPDNAAVAGTDVALSYAVGDPNAGTTPNVSAVAYTNNYAGAPATTLYDIDSGLDILAIQNPPNNGTLNTVGPLGVDISGVAGLDCTEADQAAYAVFNRVGTTNSEIYRINLSTGAASLLGAVNSVESVSDIAIPDPQPVLQISVAGTNATLTWSAASAGYVLESSPSLSPPAWSADVAAPGIVNRQKVATNSIAGLNRFFRLKK